MSDGLPPPPQRADSGDFAWVAWYNQLYALLSSTGSLAWSLVNKAGSSIADLANHSHNILSGIQGGVANEYYHLTATEYTNLATPAHNSTTGKQGGTTNEYYHLTSAQNTNVAALPTAANIVVQAFKTKAGIPTTTDIIAGNWAIYKDTSGGSIKLYANDGGTIKSVALV